MPFGGVDSNGPKEGGREDPPFPHGKGQFRAVHFSAQYEVIQKVVTAKRPFAVTTAASCDGL